MDDGNSGAPTIRSMTLLIACLMASAALIAAAQTATPEWPQWRGPFNTGMARGDAPLTVGRPHQRAVEDSRFPAAALDASHRRQSAVSDDRRADRQADAAARRAGAPAAAPTPASSIASRCSPSIATRARSPGSGPPRSPRRTRATTGRTAASRRTRRSPTARASSRSSARAGSTPTISMATLLWQKDFGVKMRMDMAFGEGTPLDAARRPAAAALRSPRHGLLVMLDAADRPGDLAHAAHRTVQLGRAVRGASTTGGGRSS